LISGVAFLDRDGVVIENINRDGVESSARNLSEIKIMENIDLLISRLSQRNVISIVVTNQPDIARGILEQSSIKLMHEYLCKKLGISMIVWCPHDDKDNCTCRKPKNGMIIFALEKLRIKKSVAQILIGDRKSDIICANKSNIPAFHLTADSNCDCTAFHHFSNFDQEILLTVSRFFEFKKDQPQR
jgi:D-glycero-D-manno-heptose 1,7-bisphosphate phosphatase